MKLLRGMLGVALVTGVAVVGAVDLEHAITRWDELGPRAPGQPLPEMRVVTLAGRELRTADLRGRITVVTFWATWCPACRQELADLDAWVTSGTMADDVEVLAINIEGRGAHPRALRRLVAGFRAARGYEVPMAIGNQQTAKAFGVGPIPHTVIVDRDGILRFVHQGRVSAETLRDEIASLR